MVENQQIVLAQFPEGMPTKDDFRYEDIKLQQPAENEVAVQTIYLSMDPYLRNGMCKHDPYVTSFKLDEPIVGRMVSKVTESRHPDFKEGDFVVGAMPWRLYNTVDGKELQKIEDPAGPLYLYLSTLGSPGQTAYHGLLCIGKPKAGETVVVSAASGSVGSVVGQIAKIKGAKVVGIAGGEEKNRYLIDELGFDEAVDYKREDYAEKLAEALPDGVDVYYENVGGDVANEVFKHLNTFARIPVCGAISTYNADVPEYEPAIQPILIKHQALMQGFIVRQFEDDFPRASKELAQWVREGKIKSKTSIAEGFDQVPKAFENLFTGQNFGKQVVQVAEE
ncbi:NADP-dependent oxidoreductase [Staphylococcus condimenti]|uniref:NADP-dependent oxidoreductase n=2 Tax=Staphylococcus condimenti TaxID=70255 RepID=A0A143PDG3_9STAP|nr:MULTISPECIES: NADP-dependent oxidoreductase [Staphylococcus]AMY06555.1 NADP-dependent oxidoreductase [Staphylococcus condimenti]APR60436.1 NADP-dependent oxidoreductase [Staphylococcus condimenti]MDK8645930.1 NADP-dependent oxidoreductase [Staphylococcus condimenti]OFP00587.1 NADP-dependent oxidoreductase [Staphylococcus sp. HMSC065E08]PNZ62204.1 NADP-dependent oxidoreductase [Staphylococcus condimenti]